MLADAQRQGVNALQCHPGVEWRDRGTSVAQDTGAGLDCKCGRTEVGVFQSMVGRVWGDERGKHWLAVAGHGPIEGSAVNDCTADCRTVAGVELRSGDDHDVCTQLKWANDGCGSHCVVNDQWYLVAVGDLGNSGDIQDVGDRVAEGLAVERLGVRLDRLLPALRVIWVLNEGELDAQAWQGGLEQRFSAAVEPWRGHDVIPGRGEGKHCGGFCGHARGECHCGDSAF